MECQKCRRGEACWLDTYTDRAVCEACCPDRSRGYGQAFVAVLTNADIRRLSTLDGDRRGGERR